MPDPDLPDRPSHAVRRATFLKGLGGLGLTAAVGPAVWRGLGGTASADAATTAGSPGSGAPASRQPQETGWTRKQPRLSTPWTRDVSPRNAHPEYPRPQLTRPHWVNLNGVWQFAAAQDGEQPPFGRDLDERILVPYPVESALSGIERHEARMFYRRRFVVPSSWDIAAPRVGHARHGHATHRLLLHLDAVDYEATVWVNGTQVGTHRGGYDRISLDVTHALHHDRHGRPAGEQELVVAAFDPTEDGVQPLGKQRVSALAGPDGPDYQTIYYTPSSGIWQTVWLEPVPAAYVERLELTPDLDDNALRVTVHVGGEDVGGADVGGGDVGGSDTVPVRATAYADGRQVGTVTGPSGRELRLPVPHAKHWTPESPFLYELRVHVLDPHGAGDAVGSYFGMRSVAVGSVDGAPHLVLNGTPLFSLSTLQQGFWPDGIYTPATDDAVRFDVERNKALGFNTIRKHQKVESDRWYHHADRIGQLVWQDMPATATGSQPPNVSPSAPPPPPDGQREFEAELHRMVTQLRNHPSIIMWIPFNEGWGQFDIARIAALVKRWDPSRIVDEMSGADTAGIDAGGGDVLDLHNIGTSPPAPVPATSHGRASVIGEFGAYGLAVPGHLWTPGFSTTPARVPDAATLNDDYVKLLQYVRGYAADQHLSGANYNLFEDAEDQVNGLHTYDRQVLKVDADRIRAVNRAVIAAGSRRVRRS